MGGLLQNKKLVIGVGLAALLAIVLYKRSASSSANSNIDPTTGAPIDPTTGLPLGVGSTFADNGAAAGQLSDSILGQTAAFNQTAAQIQAENDALGQTATQLQSLGDAISTLQQPAPVSSPTPPAAQASQPAPYGGHTGKIIGARAGSGGYIQIGPNKFVGKGGKVKTAAQAGIHPAGKRPAARRPAPRRPPPRPAPRPAPRASAPHQTVRSEAPRPRPRPRGRRRRR